MRLPDKYKFRIYSKSDYNDVIQLWNSSGLKLSLSDEENELHRLFERNPKSFFVLETERKIIGTVIGGFDGRRGYIHHLAVDPKYQKQDLGKFLMEKIEIYFKEQGIVKIHLMIEKSNSEVSSFYEHIGWHFRPDIILMSKSLREEEYIVKNDEVLITRKYSDNNQS